jgi:hypothetical protein
MSRSKKKTVHRFDSIEKLVTDNQRWGKDRTSGNSSRGHGRSDWYGTDSYESAVTLLTGGWPEGAGRVAAIRSRLERAVQAMAAAKVQEIAFGVEGEWADIGRLVTGDPECCAYTVDSGEEQQSKVVKIVANICVSACVSTEVMFARGAACVAAVDLLESLDRRVELWVGIGCDGYNDTTLDSQVLVKSGDQPVDTDRLAYVLCHPAFFRRVYFAHMELNDMNPCACVPHGVNAENAIVLPELCSGSAVSHHDIVKQVAKICELAGISFDASEVMEASKV